MTAQIHYNTEKGVRKCTKQKSGRATWMIRQCVALQIRFLLSVRKKNLTYAEMQTLLTSLKLRLEHKVDEEKTGAANEALGREARIKRY